MRTDLPVADQMVQAAHVAQVAGARWGAPPAGRLVLLQAEDRSGLQRARALCALHGIEAAAFDEPDPADGGAEPMGLTAVCTEPLLAGARRLFRGYALWMHPERS